MNGDHLDWVLADDFSAGAVGEPGSRIFYLQVIHEGSVTHFRCEKAQVAALGQSLQQALSDLPTAHATEEDASDLVEPVNEAWTVGAMGLAYDTENDRLLIMLEQLSEGEEEEPESARIGITRENAVALSARADRVVRAGRPPCPWCGHPMDLEGHLCPRMNGHGIH